MAEQRRGYLRSSSSVLVGSVVGQVVFLAVSPVLTRHYSPAAFGLAGVFTAILTIVSTPANGRYHLAISLPESPAEARGLLRLSLWITPPVSAVVGFSLFAYLELTGYGSWPVRVGAAVAMALAVSLYGLATVYQALLGRIDAFGQVGWSRAYQGVANSLASVALAPTASAAGLIGGQVAGQAAAGLSAGWGLFRHRARWRGPERVPLWPLARRYRSFPILSTPAGVLNSLGVQAPVLLIPLLFSIQATGMYALSYRVVIAPAAMLSLSLTAVYQGSAPEAHRRGQLLAEISQIIATMSQIALPLTTMIIIGGPLATRLLFGPAWIGAGRVLQLLAPWFLMVIVIAPLSPTFAVLGQLRRDLVFQTSLVVFRVLAFVAGDLLGTFGLGVALSTLCTVVHYLFFLWLVARSLDGKLARILAPSQFLAIRSLVALTAWGLGAFIFEGWHFDLWTVAVSAVLGLVEGGALLRSVAVPLLRARARSRNLVRVNEFSGRGITLAQADVASWGHRPMSMNTKEPQ